MSFAYAGHHDSGDDSLSIKLRAGGMPATTARLVEACAPPSLNESQLSIRSLRHQRQVSDSVLKDLRRDDDDDDDDEEVETKSVGTPSTLPRLSRPSSIASPATGPSKHSTLVSVSLAYKFPNLIYRFFFTEYYILISNFLEIDFEI